MMECPGSSPPTWYCGYDNVARCSGPDQKTFNLPDGWFADYRNTSSSRSTSSASQISATATSSSSCPKAATVTVPAQQASDTSAADASNRTCSRAQSCPSQNNIKAGIGAGVAIPLGLALAAALFLFRRERRLRKELSNGYRLGKTFFFPLLCSQD